MTDLQLRTIDSQGVVTLQTQGAVEALYAGHDLSGCVLEPSEHTDLYAAGLRLLDMNLPPLCTAAEQLPQTDWYAQWHTPQPWRTLDVLAHCTALCTTEAQLIRVCEEYVLFEERNMIPVLRHLIYMVQLLRQQGVLWGVGRGSSVSSYILFLIGINRIDPMKFNLDVSEFLK